MRKLKYIHFLYKLIKHNQREKRLYGIEYTFIYVDNKTYYNSSNRVFEKDNTWIEVDTLSMWKDYLNSQIEGGFERWYSDMVVDDFFSC